MENQYSTMISSPLGPVTIITDDLFVNEITFAKKEGLTLLENEVSSLAAAQLTLYFNGDLQVFSFPIKQAGTPFQQQVWEALNLINYGTTYSYAKLSGQLNNPLAIRAIAAANGKNKLAIVTPCHRVIGSDGKLVGYAGALWRKQWLLNHEKEVIQQGQMTLKF